MDGLSLFGKGAQMSLVGNCVMVQFKDEDDAIVFMECIKDMIGKTVIVESKEE